MKKTQGQKIQKIAATLSKKATGNIKKATKQVKKKTNKVKHKTRAILGKAKKQLNVIKKTKYSKTLHRTKDKIYATEKEIMDYVKENPIKSLSAVTLSALIAGFIASKYRS